MIATLDQLREAVRRVLDARQFLLEARRTDAIVKALAAAAQHWLPPSSPWRAQAVEQAPAVTGFSTEMVNEAIDRIFGAITAESLGVFLDRELGDRRALDEFHPHGPAQARAFGVPLIVHWLAGNVPAPGIHSILNGLLLRSGNVVRMSQHDTVFPRLFVESVREADPDLAMGVELLEWPHTDAALTQAAMAKADAVIAHGDDSTMAALRRAAPAGATFIGYGQKVSFAYLCREAMTVDQLPALAAAAAEDVSVYDQQGCLSPHVIYVEERGALSPRKFAAALAEAMGAFQARIPRGALTMEEAAAISTTRNGYEFRSASDRRIALWASDKPNEWLVVYEDDPSFAPSCLNRVVFVKPTDGGRRVLEAIQRHAARISTVGVAPISERTTEFAAQLARLGIHRVCPLGQMQRPPLWWFHDGRANLSPLVRWTELG
ncbi:MAG: hypothetical protein FJ395_17140 [Verrucomicrobia bacterium]|nr:hypothetical protein [Verrucomicrobiota bacterium]